MRLRNVGSGFQSDTPESFIVDFKGVARLQNLPIVCAGTRRQFRKKRLDWTWLVGTVVLAALFSVAAVISVVLAARRRRTAFLVLAAAFILAAVVFTLANPIVNMAIFNKAADRNTHLMVANMRDRCPVGHDAQDFIAIFGRPARTRTVGERHIMTYDANPWWMMGWTEIEIGVVSNKIEGHWLED